MHKIILLFLFMISPSFLIAKGKIEGKVTDENNLPLIGATVRLEGTTLGATADINGNFSINNLEYKKYTLSIGSVAYEKKQIIDVEVNASAPLVINVSLKPANKGLGDVVIKSSMKKESMNALMIQQKNMATISDGISSEMIKKSPDKNTGDVLKRVSGVSISEGKFAIIRGLSDRYNLAMLNGSMLPSSEADRKAFSFDIFPSNLLDNITIIKAATPEYPAEFAGGIIDLNTKDIPGENYISLQIGSGTNSISTFNKYYDGKNGKTDWLGLDNKSRALPTDFPTTEKFLSSSADFTKQERITVSKTLSNNWGSSVHNCMMPNRVFQLTGGYNHTFANKSSIGAVGAITYNRSQKFNEVERKEFELDNSYIYDYKDSVYKDNVLAGAMLNIGYKISGKHKITFKSNYNINSEDQLIKRSGIQLLNEQMIRSSATWFSSNTLLVSQLLGEHSITKYKIKLNWNASYNNIFRNTPDLKKTYYIRNYTSPDDTLFRAYVPMQASPNYSGRFFSTLNEKVYNGKVDASMPFKIKKVTQHIKVGVFVQSKEREFKSRELGYVIADMAKHNYALDFLPEDKIFAPENMSLTGYKIDDITQGTNSYTSDSKLSAAYLQLDNKFLNNFRMVWGVRYEHYSAALHSKTTVPILVENNFSNLLPSLNLTYMMNKKTNLRFCASKTLSRPEFREMAPFPFFDFNSSSVLVGNTKLVQTEIKNFDVRYEYFPGKGQMISASLFYKNFKNPIESILDASSTPGSRSFTYNNAPLANNYGLELEFRKTLAFISSNENSVWENISVFGNFSAIKSEIKITMPTTKGDTSFTRPLQGQSPYVVNVGISGNLPKYGFSATILYNRIGERITLVGNSYIPDLYEKSRNVVDFQLAKTFMNRAELKFTLGDILHNDFIFYQNGAKDTKTTYSKTTDNVVTSLKQGFNTGLSFSYKF